MVISNSNGPDVQPKLIEDGWEVSGPVQAGLDPDLLRAITQTIEADEHASFHALLIARHGQLVFEAYFNGYDQDCLHDIRSAGKSFTSTLIGIAIDTGAIPEVDVPVLPYFKQYEPYQNMGRWKESITVRDLLTMRSGLDADDSDLSSPGCEENMLKSDDWIRYSLDLQMREAPGQHWVYAGTNTMLLTGLLESATGRSALDFATDHLFEPLGIDNFLWQSSPQGIVAGQGFLSVCGRDMLKLGQLFLNGGTWQGRNIVAEQWTRTATRRGVEIPGDEHAGYGFHWWTRSIDLDGKRFECYFASGNGGNKILVVPSLDLAVAVASSAYNQAYMHTRSHNVLMHVIGAAI